MNNELFDFLKDFYHEETLNYFNVKTHKENVNDVIQTKDDFIIDSNMKHYGILEWNNYLQHNKIDYNCILDDILKNMIYTIFCKDFELFNYNK